jgi:hypothetical protein
MSIIICSVIGRVREVDGGGTYIRVAYILSMHGLS